MRLAANLFSVASANVVGRLINLIALSYAARIVGPQNYGVYAFGLSVAAYAGVLLSPGILVWGTRAIARNQHEAPPLYATVLAIRLVLASVGYAGAVVSMLWFSDAERLMVVLFGFVLLGTAVNGDWVLYGLERMRTVAAINVAGVTVTAAGIAIFVSTPEDVYRIPVISGLSMIALALAEVVVLRRWLLAKITRPTVEALRSALSSSASLNITSAIVVILHHANVLIVNVFAGATALGFFYAAFRFVELASVLPFVVAQVYLPRLSRLVTTDARQALEEAERFANVHLAMGLFVSIVMVVEAPSAVALLYGSAYAPATDLLRIMGVGLLFNYAIQGYTNALIAFGQDAAIVRIVAASALVSVIGGLVGIQLLGVVGSAVVIALVDLTGWLIALWYFRKTVGTFGLRSFARPTLGGGIAAVAMVGLALVNVPFPIRVSLAALLYVPFALPSVRWR